jgi:hypothetical protein
MTEDRLELEIWRGEDYLAGVEGPRKDAVREILHYLAINGQDGDAMRVVEIKRVPFDLGLLLTPSSSSPPDHPPH